LLGQEVESHADCAAKITVPVMLCDRHTVFPDPSCRQCRHAKLMNKQEREAKERRAEQRELLAAHEAAADRLDAERAARQRSADLRNAVRDARRQFLASRTLDNAFRLAQAEEAAVGRTLAKPGEAELLGSLLNEAVVSRQAKQDLAPLRDGAYNLIREHDRLVGEMYQWQAVAASDEVRSADRQFTSFARDQVREVQTQVDAIASDAAVVQLRQQAQAASRRTVGLQYAVGVAFFAWKFTFFAWVWHGVMLMVESPDLSRTVFRSLLAISVAATAVAVMWALVLWLRRVTPKTASLPSESASRGAPTGGGERHDPDERRGGMVKFYTPVRNAGLIAGDDGVEYLVVGVEGLTYGTRVSFTPHTTPKGAVASSVRIEPGPGPD
jgi:cold shock CspA family protein